MSINFWENLPKPFFALAPMADVTDVAFRQIVVQCGKPDVLYNEFVSCEGLCSAGRERLLLDLRFKENEHLIVAQFFGTKPEQFYECAKLAAGLGFDGVDINMGCPDRKVVKQGAGIGLCKNPALAKEIIAATKEGAAAVNGRIIPVSVKTRLGLRKPDLDGWIRPILETGISALVIHGRTMAEISRVPAHWDLIGEVTAMAHDADVIVVGNGDVTSLADGREKAERWRLDGIMIGRGIFQSPWIFNEKIDPVDVSSQERVALLRNHLRFFDEAWGPDSMAGGKGKSFDLMKKFFKVYISGWDGAKDLRARLMEAKTRDEAEAILD